MKHSRRTVLENAIKVAEKIARRDNDSWDFSPFFLSMLTLKYMEYGSLKNGYKVEMPINNILEYEEDEVCSKLYRSFIDIGNSSEDIEVREFLNNLDMEFDFSSKKLGSAAMDKNVYLLLNEINKIKFRNKEEVRYAFKFMLNIYYNNSGILGGIHFTNDKLSDLLVRLAKNKSRNSLCSIYDPAMGTASTLIKAESSINDENKLLVLSGNEINKRTYNIAKMNLICSGIDLHKVDIWNKDTIEYTGHIEEGYDMIVSEIPYSARWGNTDESRKNDIRFINTPVPPKSKCEFAFIMDAVSKLNKNGKAAIACFSGCMFRDGREANIRKNLVENKKIESVVLIKSGESSATAARLTVLVLSDKSTKDDIMFIDAANIYTEDILDIIENDKEIKYISKKAKYKELEKNNFILYSKKYIDQKENEKDTVLEIIEGNEKRRKQKYDIIK